MYNRSSVRQVFFCLISYLLVNCQAFLICTIHLSPLLPIMHRNILLNALESKVVMAELSWFVPLSISEARL